MGIKVPQSSTESPKAVGEIDTRAPFESVKAAVSLFGEARFSGSGEKPAVKKSTAFFAEKVLAKETQLQLAQNELNKFKEQLKNAEITKTQALSELENAKRTVEDLSNKLKTINESKESAIKATEAAKSRAKQLKESNSGEPSESSGSWKQELDSTREEYTAAISELNAAKQELRKIRQDFDASMEAKLAAFQKAEEAELSAKANKERVGEIKKEIAAAQESVMDVKLASVQAKQEHAKILSEKDAQRLSYRASVEQAEMRLSSFKREFDPELKGNLESKLAETASEVEVLQREMKNARTSDLDSVKTVTLELDDAKEALHKVAEEESSLQSLVESLKLELESVKKEHSELKEKEAETESVAGNLHVKLRKSKDDLEAALSEEAKAKTASSELITTLQQLSLESDNARLEAEDMKKKAEELKKEAEATRISLEEAEKKLQVALKEAEEAKAAEIEALDRIKLLSERTSAARASTSESGANITISTEEFESLNRKVEESDILAEMKVAAAMAQVEAVKAGENEAHKKWETSCKEIEEMKSATEEALKRAEMAEAAKKAVEGELRRWREKEQKKAAETAARILSESEMSAQSSPHHAIPQKAVIADHKTREVRKMEKTSSISKKTLLPNISGLFHRKKNHGSGGGSPSYLPGERPQ
ncbi:hypothetical protein AQUCO_09300031v1 [Aquilegia coerulea]|uniref:WEB family protein n=1 Tax=Aquilegia coerulea TaxID=218851 RepID=A0A2G5C572_AQUCA|nr:hypothetical protein AQUCO_09300031v1 [Aquilegia coerulea]